MKKKPKQLVRCHNCGRHSSYEDSVKTRPVEGHPGIEETGIDCPKCGLWIHARFDGDALAKWRARLQEAKQKLTTERTMANVKVYYRAKKRMQVEHDRFNQFWREKLNVKAPAELAKELEEADE